MVRDEPVTWRAARRLNVIALYGGAVRMRFLIRLKAPEAPPARLLAAVSAIARTFGADPRNPKWTSYGALELDVFSATRADFDLFVSAARPLAEFEFTKDLNVAPPHKDEGALFEEARSLFNAERYWESHEVLEGVWRNKHGEEKRLLQGIILVCAAFVHHQKGEPQVAMGVLKRSVPLLEYPGDYGGFRVARIRKDVQNLIGTGSIANFRV